MSTDVLMSVPCLLDELEGEDELAFDPYLYKNNEGQSSPLSVVSMSTDSDLLSEMASNPSFSPDHPLISDEDDIDLLKYLVNADDVQEPTETFSVLPTTSTTSRNIASAKKRNFSEMEDSLTERNRKNAIAARENRQKKKQYVSCLEKENLKLSTENDVLKTVGVELKNKVSCLEEEVIYLKSVLAHQSALSKLLKNIGKTDVNLTTSFEAQKSSGPRPKRRKSAATTGGVCLHVSEDNVSLEFCSKCASMAS